MIKRIGLLTSGGDCQALNATMRGVVKALSNAVEDLEVYGFDDGYKGLIYGKYHMLTAKDFSGILTRGGTILGTSRQPFKLMRVPDEADLLQIVSGLSGYSWWKRNAEDSQSSERRRSEYHSSAKNDR